MAHIDTLLARWSYLEGCILVGVDGPPRPPEPCLTLSFTLSIGTTARVVQDNPRFMVRSPDRLLVPSSFSLGQVKLMS